MRKTDKKIDKALRIMLTEVCAVAQKNSEGFVWLTHFANYADFPRSLSVVCIYDTENHLADADLDYMRTLIKEKLALVDISMNDIRSQVSFDTEESCTLENNGNWNQRIN